MRDYLWEHDGERKDTICDLRINYNFARRANALKSEEGKVPREQVARRFRVSLGMVKKLL